MINLSVPYRIDENIFKEQYSSWENAYLLFEKIIKCNKRKITNETMTICTDIDNVFAKLENEERNFLERKLPPSEEIGSEKHYQEYDIELDFQYLQKYRNVKSIVKRTYQLVKHP